VDEEYRKLIENIAVENEDYTEEEMKEVYKEQKTQLDSLNTLLGGLFISYGVIGLLKMTTSQKAHTDVKTLLKNMGSKLATSEVEKVTSIISTVYSDTYYKNAFTQQIGIDIELKFNMLKKEYIDAAVNAKYKGEMFSGRIWANKVDMMDKLQQSLTDTMNGKSTIDKVARDIKNAFNVTAYESQRLVNTEMARCQSQASVDIANSIGIEKHMWSATLDMLTNEEDAGYDGQLFNVNDTSEPQVPLHPNCRCCWVDVPYEGWSPTQRRDNITKENIDYTDYKTWKESKGI